MFSLLNFSPSLIKLGQTYNVVSLAGTGVNASQASPALLTVPFQDPIKYPEMVSLLGWHYQLSTFQGRDEELAELREWALDPRSVSVLIVNGEGGVGKSRLAAEFALELQGAKWSAGFIDLRESRAFPLAQNGTLIIIDYPEENRKQVTELLHDLALLGTNHRLRVLLLSRQGREQWESVVGLAKARGIVENRSLYIGGLESRDALLDVFNSAQERATEVMVEDVSHDPPVPVSGDALQAWIEMSPEHRRPLFIIALALYTCLFPQEDTLRYTAGRIMHGLVTRELDRLRALGQNYPNPLLFCQLAALASINGQLSLEELDRASLWEVLDVEHAPPQIVENNTIVPLRPDILAAVFVDRVLGESGGRASSLVWKVVELNSAENLARCARLTHDLSLVVANDSCSHLLSALLGAVENNIDRARNATQTLLNDNNWRILPEMQIAAYKMRLRNVVDPKEKSIILTNLGSHFSEIGNEQEAFTASMQAVEIDRELARSGSITDYSSLAISLNNLADTLDALGRTDEALDTVREAVRIYKRIGDKSLDILGVRYASLLSNYSAMLSKNGKYLQALNEADKSVRAFRVLDQYHDDDEFKRTFAAALGNLSTLLDKNKKRQSAISIREEAIDVMRPLAKRNAVINEPMLARLFYEYSLWLEESARSQEALTVIEEAVEIWRSFARQNFSKYKVYFLDSLMVLADFTEKAGDVNTTNRLRTEIEFIRNKPE